MSSRKVWVNKRIFLFIVALAPFFLTSCSLSNPASYPFIGSFLSKKGFNGSENEIKEPVTLSYWGLWETSDIVNPQIARFNKTNPSITIEYEKRPSKDLFEYKDTVMTRLSEGTAPDIFLAHVSWISSLRPYLSSAPGSVFTSDEAASLFYSDAVNNCVIENAVYCIPFSYDGLALLYNKSLFAKKGIKDPPVDWEQFREYALRLTERDDKGRIAVSGAAIGTSRNIAFSTDILALMFVQSNVAIPQDLESKAAQDALTFYTTFSRKDKVWDSSMVYSPISFAQGKVAMMFAPSWVLLGIKESNPSLSIGVAPVPQVPILDGEGLTNKGLATYWVLAVSGNSKSKKDAWEYLKYVSSRNEQLSSYSVQSQYRPFGQIYSLKELKENVSANDLLAPYVFGADNAVSTFISDRSGNDPYVDIMNTAIDASVSNASSASALISAKASLEAVLSGGK